MAEKLLVVNDLYVTYQQNKKTVKAVNGVSFRLSKGKTLGLVGETGAGKTTIAKSILQILPDTGARIEKGEILFEDKDLLKCSEKEILEIRGKKIAMIFQDPLTALNPLMTIGEQIEETIVLHNHGMSDKEVRKKAGEMLELVGIPVERLDEYPHQFSGGMKQRVVIAMALACNPELLLADEPTTALDVTIQAQVLELMRDLREQLDTSMILITHDLGVVAQNCDDVAVVYAGQIVESGSKEDLFDSPCHPYTLGLFRSLPDMALGEKRLHSIPGMPPDPTNLPQGCPFAPRCEYCRESCHGEIPTRQLSGVHFCKCVLEENELKQISRDVFNKKNQRKQEEEQNGK